jgi:hypothetical protein
VEAQISCTFGEFLGCMILDVEKRELSGEDSEANATNSAVAGLYSEVLHAVANFAHMSQS